MKRVLAVVCFCVGGVLLHYWTVRTALLLQIDLYLMSAAVFAGHPARILRVLLSDVPTVACAALGGAGPVMLGLWQWGRWRRTLGVFLRTLGLMLATEVAVIMVQPSMVSWSNVYDNVRELLSGIALLAMIYIWIGLRLTRAHG